MLPDRVTERFPFVVTGNKQIGMPKFMLYAFVELITSQVQFGTFANAMNTIYALKYDMSRLSYYRSFIDWKRKVGPHLGADFPEPFAKYDSVGEYNGIKITEGTMKQLFINFVQLHEPCMQASFQTKSDKGHLLTTHLSLQKLSKLQDEKDRFLVLHTQRLHYLAVLLSVDLFLQKVIAKLMA
jgi:hypothetical protein